MGRPLPRFETGTVCCEHEWCVLADSEAAVVVQSTSVLQRQSFACLAEGRTYRYQI